MDEINKLLEKSKELMKKDIEHLNFALSKIRAGRANPGMLDNIYVSYYSNNVSINQMSSVTVLDARTLQIKPWEKQFISNIEKAIIDSKLGITPINDGETIKIIIPQLTEERRIEFTKTAKAECEKAKIAVRNHRNDIKENIKTLQKNGTSEDITKKAENDLQTITDNFIKSIDSIYLSKEKELMTL